MGPDTYDSTMQRGTGPVYTRIYRKRGRYAHLRELASSCQVLRQWWYIHDDGWLGTGSQAEYERAEALPLCPWCFRAREARLPDPRLGAGHGVEMT